MKEFKDIKIFLVDDDLFSLNLYEQHVRKLGFTNIDTYPNGTTTLNNLTENPGIIFLDYAMQGPSGIEVLKEIKKINPLIYVVMLSGEGNKQVVTESLECGAFNYIRKGDQEIQKMELVLHQIGEIHRVLHSGNS